MIRHFPLAVALLAAFASAFPAVAQTPSPSTPLGWPSSASIVSTRPQAMVDGPVVRLSDLFDGIDGDRANVALGPSPAPGANFAVEAPQLAAIARTHGLAWNPLSASERVVVERPGRAVTREEVATAVREGLTEAGADAETEVELAPFAEVMFPASVHPRISVESPSLDPSTGRFSATLAVAAEGMPTRKIRVTGRPYSTEAVVVAARRIAQGEVLTTSDVRVDRLRVGKVRDGAAREASDVVGQRVIRPIAQGMPISSADTAEAMAVERHSPVTIVLDSGVLRLTAQGRALESGAIGASVPVVNLGTRVVVDGEIMSPGVVRVALGSQPRQVDPQMRARADYAVRLEAANARAARSTVRR